MKVTGFPKTAQAAVCVFSWRCGEEGGDYLEPVHTGHGFLTQDSLFPDLG